MPGEEFEEKLQIRINLIKKYVGDAFSFFFK